MKILFVTSSSPFPPHTGGQKRSFHLLKYLASKGSVTLVSAVNSDVYQDHLASFSEYCEKTYFEDIGRVRAQAPGVSLLTRVGRLLTGFPWILEDYATPGVYERILESQPEKFDLILIRYAEMAYFFLTDQRLRKLLGRVVIDVDDVSPISIRRTINRMPWGYRRLRYLLDLFFLESYFKKLKDACLCLAVSEKDKEYLFQKGFAKRIFVAPNMIEVNGRIEKAEGSKRNSEILFGGMLSYPPNQDAIIYFCEEIFQKIQKQIPEIRLTITGKGAPERIARLGTLPGVEYAGYVPSMEPYYERTSLIVCPLLNGAGTRIKILDAMAHGRPVVSTTIGAEGLGAVDGEHLLIADEPEAFAEKCVELLRDPVLWKKIADKGYALVKEKYDVSVFERKMDEALGDQFIPGGINWKVSQELTDGSPLVSVILPTYNRASYLKRAIQSVLNQTFQDWELIVVDDGSTDETKEVVMDPSPQPSPQRGEGVAEDFPLSPQGGEGRVRGKTQYVYQPNAGVAYARNNALSHAQGKYVAFLDDDDEWLPEKLERQVEFMEANPAIGLTYTCFKVMRTEGPKAGQFKIFPEKLATTFEEMIDSFFIPSPTVMIRRSCLVGMSWFNPQFEISEDQDLWFRFIQRWKIAACNQPLTFTVMDEREHVGADRIAVHRHMIEVMEHMKLAPHLERFRPLMEKKKAKLRYAIARDYIDRGEYREAGLYFAKALLSDPFVGLGMARPGEEGIQLLLRVFKAYLAVPACFLKGLIHDPR